jgi:hypothetical protein
VGLNLVLNTAASGTTGLLGLTGEENNGEEEPFATNYTIGDTDPTYLYSITDDIADTANPGDEDFTELAAAPADTNFKDVSFAPSEQVVPKPASLVLLATGRFGAGALRRRKKV